jgi:hypothetical protein
MLACFAAFANPSADASTAESGESESAYSAPTKHTGSPYVFGWMNYQEPTVKLRGGTTTGTPVTLSSTPSDRWNALQAGELDPIERDRRAILAMEGEYKISFDFLEVEVFGENTEPSAPYRSWATERVLVLEETETAVSLQHIIVMFMQMDDGTTQGPMLIKHWRQDWQYEPTTALDFVGDGHWTNRPLAEAERTGKWQQTVYQVDDGPRYSMLGAWEHTAAYSAWHGESAWRPLPRREYTVRSDYQTLVGTNRLTVLPTGWVHTQDNIKTVLSGLGTVDKTAPAVAREFGVNRYERIVDFDFSEADTYWSKTGPFWSRVRTAWAKHLTQSTTVTVSPKCEDKRTYELLFGLAEKVGSGNGPSPKKEAKKIENILGCSVAAAE